MGIAFESLSSDIAGRCGRLTVGKKTVKTPALLPVINPHLLLVTPKELQAMGISSARTAMHRHSAALFRGAIFI